MEDEEFEEFVLPGGIKRVAKTWTEYVLPGGTFRTYNDNPTVGVQILQPGELDICDKIMAAFEAGEIKKK